ncbi:hypothetical protein THOB06_120025 [Vibrio rotiferianus]|nr:hypothetical protein THOE12_10165 [Vibrio rotiferianus]CAH1559987.1 hypothetical protein THOG10_120026 [Vibrio rotiferianus]CAH1561738.1 hypothetical protein THOB06_120025 [Vibrio rotiferianus]
MLSRILPFRAIVAIEARLSNFIWSRSVLPSQLIKVAILTSVTIFTYGKIVYMNNRLVDIQLVPNKHVVILNYNQSILQKLSNCISTTEAHCFGFRS